MNLENINNKDHAPRIKDMDNDMNIIVKIEVSFSSCVSSLSDLNKDVMIPMVTPVVKQDISNEET